MWTTFQDQSFLLGAALITLFHATKFGELNPDNPITGRYIALLPGATVRDFAGPCAYRIALAAFLSVSLIAYYLCCQMSPNILTGAAKLLGNAEVERAIQGVPYPLYVAALFIGLTQPIVPMFARFGEAQRDFFHDQIEVPRRVIDIAETLTSAIETRAGTDKRHLAREVRNLTGGEVLSTLQTYGDLAFYKLQLERLNIGDPATLEKTVKESSVRELRGLIERLVFCTLVAVMRKSGTKSLRKVAETIGTPSIIPRFNKLGHLLAGITASGLLFSICLLTIAHVFVLLAEPIAGLFGRSPAQSLWPSDLDNVGHEFWTMVPPIFVCLIVAVSLLVPSEQAPAEHSERPRSSSLSVDLVNFFRSGVYVLGLCIVVSILIKIAQMFYEYGTFNLPKDALSSARLMLPVIQSFIPVAVCLFTTWYLASSASGPPLKGLSLTRTLLVIAGVVSFLAILYDLTFLHEYLRVRPQDAPGWEHLLFSVVANALISICAFVSVVLFFKGRSIFQKRPVTLPTQRECVSDIGTPSRRSFNLHQRSVQTIHHCEAEMKSDWSVRQPT